MAALKFVGRRPPDWKEGNQSEGRRLEWTRWVCEVDTTLF